MQSQSISPVGGEPRQRESVRAQLKIHHNKQKLDAKDDILNERQHQQDFEEETTMTDFFKKAFEDMKESANAESKAQGK